MTSNDIKITINSNLDIIESSTQPSAPTNEVVHKLVLTPAIDGPSEEIKNPAFNSQLEMMRISEHGSAASSSTSERPSNKVNFLDNEMPKLHDEIQRRADEMQQLIARKERWSIPKVPYRLRQRNHKIYEPNAISIGPYHHDKVELRAMDDVKRNSFAYLVKVTKLELNEFVKSMKPLKEQVLNCYERPMYADLDSDDKFIEMMVFDGCFIVQLIREIYSPELAQLPRHIQNDILDDLLLVENQLPFFVLLELDRVIAQKVGGDLVKFEKAALSYFVELDAYSLKIFSESIWEPNSPDGIKHLLDLVHKCCRPSPKEENSLSTKFIPSAIKTQEAKGSIRLLKFTPIAWKIKEAKGSIRSWKLIRSASELDNAGIDFVGVEERSLFSVTFTKYTNILRLKIRKKVLKIPTLYVRNNTESRLRNLMAHELFTPFGEPTYVSDYVVLMDNLIDTGEDVQLLCTSGVIENQLADDEAVAQMFNELGGSTFSKEDFYYAEIVGKVNQHCKENTRRAKCNKSIANLKKEYFSSPWSYCSFLAAVILLVATLLQTAYTLISYYHPS